jgi:hypothetical protein
MSLIVCNIPVVVTAAIRLRKQPDPKARKGPIVSTFIKFSTRIWPHKDSSATANVTAITLSDVGSRSIQPWSSTDTPKGSDTMVDTKSGFEKGSSPSWTADPSHAV